MATGGEEMAANAEPSLPKPGPLWRNRDYLLLWRGQAASVIGDAVQSIALPLLILAVTRSVAQAGIVAALQTLPFPFLSLPAGALVDRWDRKRVMIVCDVGRAIATGSIPLALWVGHLTMLQVYLVAIICGVLTPSLRSPKPLRSPMW